MSLPIDASHRACNASARMRARGFTLIELVAVIVILGVLAVVAVPAFVDLRRDTYDTSGRAKAAALHAGIESARIRWRMTPNGGVAAQDLAGVGDGTWDFDDKGNLVGTSYAGSGDMTNTNCAEVVRAVIPGAPPVAIAGLEAFSPHGLAATYVAGVGCVFHVLDAAGATMPIPGDVYYLGYDPAGASGGARGRVWSRDRGPDGGMSFAPNAD